MIVVIEGNDGSGKSTAAKGLVARLCASGLPAVYYREPGGTPMGEDIRDVLLASRTETVDPITEMLLFFAARRQGIVNFINHNRDKIIVMDRFVHSSYAYQVGGGNAPKELYIALVKHVLHDMGPVDKAFHITVSKDVAESRMGDRKVLDRIEQQDDLYFERVSLGYKEAIDGSDWDYIWVDGTLLEDQVVDVMFNHIMTSR